jgi:TolA-binding protein
LLKIPQLHPDFRGESKLLLGDAFLIKDEVWEARLLYGQVDKEFKEEALGQEAKFRNAQLAYFMGDFEWARGQLDILKTATSQLISNNAIELSLLIQDNTGLDSTEDAMKEYAHAQFLLYQNKLKECLEVLNMLPLKYPNHSLHDEIYFLKAEVMVLNGKFDDALKYYSLVYSNFGSDILADNSLFKAAEIYQFVKKDLAKAYELYENLIIQYNSSLYVIESRKRYESLKGKLNES